MFTTDKMCRLCMARSNLIHSIFEDNLLQKVAICVSILINPGDKTLPLEVCALCVLKVKDFYEFRQNCQKVQLLFEQTRSSVEENITSSDLVPKLELCSTLAPSDTEPLKITKLEVEFETISTEGEQIEEYELLNDEESEVELEHIERLEDTPLEDNEESLSEHDELNLDAEDLIESDFDQRADSLVAKNEYEIVELLRFDNNGQNEAFANPPACVISCLSSPIQDLQEDDGMNNSRTKLAVARKRKKRERTKVKPRDEKEIYQSLLLKCERCGKFVERNRMEGHINRHEGIRPYTCNVSGCGTNFHCKIALRLHTQGRHSSKQLPCDICGKVYSSTKTLYHHKKETHSEKQFKCDICDLAFVSNARLNRHRMTHSDIREFKCSYCSKEFYRSNNLKVHLRSHTKEKPFMCSACPKAFGYQRLLRDHVARHHH
ncbi:zinc finger protein 226-like [Topomyia yanbarensis]|uniref:zinc finger protein 226-like n=1 Tax=Topomyia yanbarensis TaxID=2498891 RepID=UPI00273C46BA|nr:zinc finger protein 226-like [Topomyia yanbarensis]